MRDDFNKVIVERERPGSSDHYHNYRHMRGPKGFKDDEAGGREPMKYHYRVRYQTKPFNENLNPLYGWLRSIVGKNWDKCYSELRKKFDARGVINNHILEHLYQDLQTQAYLNAKGAVVCMAGNYSNRGEVPISRCGKDYYVCPKDGTVKKTQKPPRRSVVMEAAANKIKAELAVKRILNDREVLHLVDGVWYHFDLKEVPTVKITYDKPLGTDIFSVGYSFGPGKKEKAWNELNQSERERFGKIRITGGTAEDELTNEVVYNSNRGSHRGHQGHNRYNYAYTSWAPAGLYHANKKTANKKQLKAAGL
jgi:hypothetical protein